MPDRRAGWLSPGVWLILIGIDHVKPASVDLVKRISLRRPPEKRPSDQTA
jgi:hypothetical protein